jgi:hypothetical protein
MALTSVARWGIGASAMLWLLAPAPSLADSLPRTAVSLPNGAASSAIMRVVQGSESRDCLVVLPALTFRIGDSTTSPAPVSFDEQLRSTADDLQLYRHLLLEFTDLSVTGRALQQAIDQRVDELLAALSLGASPVKGLFLEVIDHTSSRDVLHYALATLTLRAKAIRPGLHVGVVISGSLMTAESAHRVAAYADSMVFDEHVFAESAEQIADLSLGKPVVRRVSGTSRPGSTSPVAAWLDALLTSAAQPADTIWLDVPTVADLQALLTARRFLASSLSGGFEITAIERAPTAVLIDGRPAVPALAFVGSQSADVGVLLKPGESAQSPHQLSVLREAADSSQLSCYDALTGRVLRQEPTGQALGCTADAEYVFLRLHRGDEAQRLFEVVSVKASAGLRVEEIIARWQAVRESERLLLRNYKVPCRLGMHFQSGGAMAIGFDVALDLEEFVDSTGVQEWVQRDFYINGVRFTRGTQFPLPMLEPDKVVTRPLELSPDQKYDYRLLGTDEVDGTLAYVVSIEPTRTDEMLYAGKVWIDGLTYRQMRLVLEQRSGRNNVAAHAETQEFGRIRDQEGHEFTLLRFISAQDTINLAGRSVTLEKYYQFGDYAINAAEFGEDIAAARESDAPMYRDTDEGLRTLRKDGPTRVVEQLSAKRVRALVGGFLRDGTLSLPVPLAGFSWTDFDFRKSGAQLSLFFAGPFLNANLSRQWNKQVRTSVEVQVSALPSTDRTYAGDTELSGEEVRSFSQWIATRADWQASVGWSVAGAWKVEFLNYQATSHTAPDFAVPPNGFNLEASGEATYVKRGFSFSAALERTWRPNGGTYGFSDRPAGTTARSFDRYAVDVKQHLFGGKLTRGGVAANYFGGRRLDRFARYKPSLMAEPRLRGIPSGTESFDEVALVGGFYAFNVLDLIKLEATLNHAWTRNRDDSTRFGQFDGCDLNIGTTGPWSTYVQASAGAALRGNLSRYRSRWDMYVTIFKPLSR